MSSSSYQDVNFSEYSISENSRFSLCKNWKITCIVFCCFKKNEGHIRHLVRSWVWWVNITLWDTCSLTIYIIKLQQQRWDSYCNSASRSQFATFNKLSTYEEFYKNSHLNWSQKWKNFFWRAHIQIMGFSLHINLSNNVISVNMRKSRLYHCYSRFSFFTNVPFSLIWT